MSDTKDSVKIRHLMEQAERLPKQDCIVVLKAVMATVAEEHGDWTQTLRMATGRRGVFNMGRNFVLKLSVPIG